MAFTPKKQAFNASINAVTLGTGDKSIVIGGENVLPFSPVRFLINCCVIVEEPR